MNHTDKYISWEDAYEILKANHCYIFNENGINLDLIRYGDKARLIIEEKLVHGCDNQNIPIFRIDKFEYMRLDTASHGCIFVMVRAPIVYPEDKYSDPRYDK